MQDNTNKTTQELFDKLMLGFSKHFEKSSRRLDDDFEYESKDKIPNIKRELGFFFTNSLVIIFENLMS